MLQGVGSRFDFHVCKTLSDLRYVKFFDPKFLKVIQYHL